MTNTDTKVDADIEEMLDAASKTEEPWKLILFNDDHHDMFVVQEQVMKAVKCTAKKAMSIMLEAHQTGQAVALTGPKDAVKKAGNILMEIDLAIDIVKA